MVKVFDVVSNIQTPIEDFETILRRISFNGYYIDTKQIADIQKDLKAYIKINLKAQGILPEYFEDTENKRVFCKTYAYNSYIRYTTDPIGCIVLDVPHIYVMLRAIEQQQGRASEAYGKIYALYVYTYGKQILETLIQMQRKCKGSKEKNKIQPVWNFANSTLFYRAIPEFSADYISLLTVPKDCTGYTFKIPLSNLNLLTGLLYEQAYKEAAFLTRDSLSVENLFYSFLSKEEQDILLPCLISGNFLVEETKYTKAVEEHFKNTLGYDNPTYTLNQYTVHIKPMLRKLLARQIQICMQIAAENGFTSKEFGVYFLNDNCFGVYVADGYTLKDVMGNQAKFFCLAHPSLDNILDIGSRFLI